jgi:leucyl/phenylalanyl-tRNA--protein transferase
MADMQEDSDDEDAAGNLTCRVVEGLVAVGGAVTPAALLRAYRAGIFPWSSDPMVTWWSPDPRAIFDLESYRPSRSLRKRIRRRGWTFTVDRDFETVMRRCAEPTASRPSTWITGDFIAAYTELSRQGFAHSVEVYEKDELVGGLYGVTIGAFFGGESMFNRTPDASKAAVAHLIQHLRARGFVLLDAQVPSPHLASLGAIEISREDYLARLAHAIALPVTF